ncbi:MAG TPA: DUF2914 domain-containing protein [Myxococcales bacterium]|nr:DUF2914 domain-containing protein [Myxococcales bacterium]
MDAPPPDTLVARLQAFKSRNERIVSTCFFLGGFLFDAVMLSRIDEPLMLVQQGGYLIICGALIAYQQRLVLKKLEPPVRLRKVWHYADHLLHFMLGTLLNAYSIFYFQSASGVTAICFVVFIAALLAVNEMPRFHKLGPVVVYALYSICLTSYFAYLFPVLLGHLRPWMFYLSVGVASALLLLQIRYLLRWSESYLHVARHAAIPAFGVQALFLLLYSLRLAPPVPLAIKQIGIYHDVKRVAGGWELSQQQGKWKFWQHADENFLERPGDKLFCFVRIFAPRHFKDAINIVWYHHDDELGWRLAHRLPLSVSASSNVGFGTDAYLTEPMKGDWRVEIESQDGRTIGQLRFKVSEDPSTDPRELTLTFSESKPLEKS